MKSKVKKEILIAYEINGLKCGRDKNGIFHCYCGKCKPLTQVSHNGNYSSNNSSNSGND